MLLSYLRKYAVGTFVKFWEPINCVADEIVGHDREFSPKNRTVRHQMRIEVSKVMMRLIEQGKVIRSQAFCRNKVRLNEAYVENRSLIR